MTSIVQDLRFAVRSLFQRPSVTIAAIVALGLAIGSTSAIFSVVNAVLLKPLSFNEPDRVAIVWESNPVRGLDIFSASPANFNDWEKQNTVFESISAYSAGSVTVTGVEESESPPNGFRERSCPNSSSRSYERRLCWGERSFPTIRKRAKTSSRC
jgi:hypothetical protein